MVDEELLGPSREYLAMLRGRIYALKEETAEKVSRCDDPEYAREMWGRFHLAVEPMYREIEAVTKVMADYYNLQPMPSIVIPVGRTPEGS